MGLKTSPAILQKLMTKVLCGTEDFTGCLLDDVTIFSDTWKGHLKDVREVLERLRAASLTLNVAKCQFCLRSMQILGYTLMDGQITPSDEKIEAILKLGPAKTSNNTSINSKNVPDQQPLQCHHFPNFLCLLSCP